MHMHDWNKYRNQRFATASGFGNLCPDTVKGCATLGGAVEKTGQLGAETRELIAPAVAVSLRCDGCIAVHAAAARKRSATKQKIAEALGVAVSITAGAALVCAMRALNAFDAASENQATA
jgi:AhpD family alkylhydroperoxidase